MFHLRSSIGRHSIGIAGFCLILAVFSEAYEMPHQADAPTFSRDIAPIFYRQCSSCHHPGGSAPFSLLKFEEARSRAETIARATLSRFMPPWLPEPGRGEFIGERRLVEREISTIRAWVEAGAPEGNPADLPPFPELPKFWALGQPDLVVEMEEEFVVPATGTDVFRNFVIPAPVDRTRFVRAVEILPGNPRVVHHANLLIDRTGRFRTMERQEPGVGFGGMEIDFESEQFEPQSHFLFWKPGTVPYEEEAGMAWILKKGTDLVLNAHLQPTGKPEPIRVRIALYFTEDAPDRHSMLIQWENDGSLDIPPGERRFEVTDFLTLPVDVTAYGVYPHAHYLGRVIEGYALLPDGSRHWLIRIPEWNFNWQAVYRFRKPLQLPAGSRLQMRITYDNSSENPMNPNDPPVRVHAGNRSVDEMAHLWIQVVAESREYLRQIQEAVIRRRLEKNPRDSLAMINLGAALQLAGKLGEAVEVYRRALEIDPSDASAHNSLGAAYLAQQRPLQALERFEIASRLDPEYAAAHYNLGSTWLRLGDWQKAEAAFQKALELQPDDPSAAVRMGQLAARAERFDEAWAWARRALEINSEFPGAHSFLGALAASSGHLDRAAAAFSESLRLDSGHLEGLLGMGDLAARQGNLAEAIAYYLQVVQAAPENADHHNNLGTLYAMDGRLKEAVDHFEKALSIDPEHARARQNLQRARGVSPDPH